MDMVKGKIDIYKPKQISLSVEKKKFLQRLNSIVEKKLASMSDESTLIFNGLILEVKTT